MKLLNTFSFSSFDGCCCCSFFRDEGHIFEYRAVFKLSVESIPEIQCFDVALLRYVIGLKNLCHPRLNQSDAKPTPIATRFPVFGTCYVY